MLTSPPRPTHVWPFPKHRWNAYRLFVTDQCAVLQWLKFPVINILKLILATFQLVIPVICNKFSLPEWFILWLYRSHFWICEFGNHSLNCGEAWSWTPGHDRRCYLVTSRSLSESCLRRHWVTCSLRKASGGVRKMLSKILKWPTSPEAFLRPT